MDVTEQAFAVKPAVTATSEFSVTAQEPVPLQPAPFQPSKFEPAKRLVFMFRVTVVPLWKDAEHVAPQLTPLGLVVIRPLPAPLFVTLMANACVRVMV